MTTVEDIFPQLHGKGEDPRARRYLTPKRILWKNGQVRQAKALLEERTSQITLGDCRPCVLKNTAATTSRPSACAEAVKAAVLLDFGIEFHGSLRLLIWKVDSQDGSARLRIRFGESAMEAMTDLGVKNTTNDHANRDFVLTVNRLSGMETNESGFRFVRIDLLDDQASVSIKAIEGVFIFRDIAYQGSFECDDPLINRIWKTAAYTAHLNMQEYLWDGIKRDRLVWIGDMQTEVMTICSVFGYNEVVPKSLDFVRDETPVGQWMNGISSYSLWWLFIQYDWYMALGDLDYLNRQKDYLLALLGVLITKVDEQGLEILPEVRFIDWPNSGNTQAVHAGLQGMLLLALEKGAYLAGRLGHPALAGQCADTAARMVGHVPDPNGSKQAGAFLVCAGLADAGRMDRELLSVGGARGFSTFLGYYTLTAMAKAGNIEGALAALKEYWGGMLNLGATTFWEDFNLEWTGNAAPIDELVPAGKDDIHGDFGAHCYVKFRHSLCHGWASGPVPFLAQQVLGVKISEPGGKTILIKPDLGPLRYAKGNWPTPYGNLEITHQRQPDGTIKTKVTAPAEVTCRIWTEEQS